MLEEPHHLELPEDSLGADETLEHVGEFLEGNSFAVPGIRDGPDHAEGAVADGPVRLVVRIGISWKKEERKKEYILCSENWLAVKYLC